MEHNVLIEEMLQEDWVQVRDIYLGGIATGQATFQKEAPSWDQWDRGHVSECRIVARNNGIVIGWAALTPVSSRCVYAGVAEVSVYVSQSIVGKGVGSKLLYNLIRRSEEQGFWTLQSSIFPENAASIKIHMKNGFRELGRRERIGKMDGVWRDTVLFERRSDKVGVS